MQADLIFQRALDLMERNKVEEAYPLLAELHGQFPQDARINFSLAVLADRLDENDRALHFLKKAAAVAKKKPIVFEQLARTLIKLGEESASIEAARKAVKLDPQNPDMHAVLGDAYRAAGRNLVAERSYQAALKLVNDHADALCGLAEIKVSLGETEAAKELFQRATRGSGDTSNAYIRLSGMIDGPNDQATVEAVERLIADGGNSSPPELGRLYWAAASALDKLGELDRAFEHYDKGRQLLYPPYDPGRRDAMVSVMKETFTREFFRERRGVAFDSAKPVFVFGMPRSGTTLVEQIIGRHSRAVGAGEVPYFHRLHAQLGFTSGSPEDYARIVTSLDEKEFRRIGRKYLTLLDSFGSKALRVVDKFPQNFNSAWLLALLFPNASFVHCTREPVDTCISILTKPLKAAHSYNRSQEALGHYYRSYRATMAHWHDVLPVTMRDQSYEALVADQEAESRELIAHTGLDWEDACLEFYKGDRPVITFSQEQVRKPIFTSSIGRWRRYEEHIGPLLEALGELAPPRD